jgi:hypothetical protein
MSLVTTEFMIQGYSKFSWNSIKRQSGCRVNYRRVRPEPCSKSSMIFVIGDRFFFSFYRMTVAAEKYLFGNREVNVLVIEIIDVYPLVELILRPPIAEPSKWI